MSPQKNSVRIQFQKLPLGKVKSFWFLMASQFSEQIADSLNLIVTMAALLAAFHGDTFKVSMCIFIPMFIPVVLLGPIAGVFVDRISKRQLLLSAAIGR